MTVRNRVVEINDLYWPDLDPLPEGGTITVEGGKLVLVAPVTGDLVDAGHSNTTNPDLIDAGSATENNPDLFDGGST